MLFSALLFSAILFSAILFSAILFSSLLFIAILFSAGNLLTKLSPVKTKMTNVLKGGKEVTRTDICKWIQVQSGALRNMHFPLKTTTVTGTTGALIVSWKNDYMSPYTGKTNALSPASKVVFL